MLSDLKITPNYKTPRCIMGRRSDLLWCSAPQHNTTQHNNLAIVRLPRREFFRAKRYSIVKIEYIFN